MLSSLFVMAGLAGVLGIVLGYAALRFRVEGNSLVEKIDDVLPQTQCGQCGYPGCRPYAEAMAAEQADINQCPPGGEAGIRQLAKLLDVEFKALNAEHGETKSKALAVIDEQTCIGCTLCIQACPVDAIMGASKQMHTVLAQQCTGCELCIAPCPVDCIVMQAPPLAWRIASGMTTLTVDRTEQYRIFNGTECGFFSYVCRGHIALVAYYRHLKTKIVAQRAAKAGADQARSRHEFRLARLAREQREKAERHAQQVAAAHNSKHPPSPLDAQER